MDFIFGKLRENGKWEKELFRDGLAFTKDTRLLCVPPCYFIMAHFSFLSHGDISLPQMDKHSLQDGRLRLQFDGNAQSRGRGG